MTEIVVKQKIDGDFAEKSRALFNARKFSKSKWQNSFFFIFIVFQTLTIS